MAAQAAKNTGLFDEEYLEGLRIQEELNNRIGKIAYVFDSEALDFPDVVLDIKTQHLYPVANL